MAAKKEALATLPICQPGGLAFGWLPTMPLQQASGCNWRKWTRACRLQTYAEALRLRFAMAGSMGRNEALDDVVVQKLLHCAGQ